jgi:serine acetyltransferase
VTMGAGVVLGSRVKLLRAVGMGTAGYRDKERDGWPVIGDDCVVCDGAKVFGPVRVGDRSTIGTSVVLFESVPADSVVALRQDLDIRTGDRSENARSFDIG